MKKNYESVWMLILVIVLVFLVAVAFIVGMGLNNNNKKSPKDDKKVAIVTPTPTPNPVIKRVRNNLKKNGFDSNIELGKDVDESKDKSTTSNGAFYLKGIKNPLQMTKFLKSGTIASKALLGQLLKQTKASKSKKDILNVKNWVAVQPNQPFVYPGNTTHSGGKVKVIGLRKGNPGDIFLAFAGPNSKVVVYVRGACANPQVIPPRPNKPQPKPIWTPRSTPKPTPKPTLTPKSSNPADYKKPGDDDERDSGTGTKPKIPKVTSKPDKTPPLVAKSTARPGDETGGNAPGTETTKPNNTPKPNTTTKPVEPGVNPTPAPKATAEPNKDEIKNPWD